MIFSKEEGYLEFRNGNEIVQIMPWGENSFRVISRPNGTIDLTAAALLPVSEITPEISIADDQAVIINGKIKAIVQKKAGFSQLGKITFYNQKEELLLTEADSGGALLKKARWYKSIAGGDFQMRATFQGMPEEKIYGMGQYQQDNINLKGCHLELAHRNSQASIPFYLSNRGYGFFWHNPGIGEVFFGENITEWRAESSKQLDYWITAEDSPHKIQQQFANAVGKAPMMPEYGMGFWQCKLRYSTQEEVIEIAREYYERKIPVDVLVIDYYHWPRCGDYRFDQDFFPDPVAMVKKVASYGIKLMVSIWPQIDQRSENYQELKESGLLVQTESGIDVQMLFHGNNVFYDATNPKARQYVWEKVKQNYISNGIKLFWLDEAEPEFGTYDFENYRYYSGSVLQVGNTYPREYIRGFFEGEQKNHLENSIKLVRCAWAGSQRYGALVWSGDIHSTYQDFKNQIVAGLQMGIAGIPWWTSDIGGFHGGDITSTDFQELLIRWFQFATFCPVMRMHGSRLPHKAIFKKDGEETEQTGAVNEIWSYGEKNYAIMKKFIEIRELLRNYTRDLMEIAHKEGLPVMRTMFTEFPDDKITWSLSTQYMYGPEILVAPIVEPKANSRKVYLPLGASWQSAQDGEIFNGGQWVMVQANLETMPLFLKNQTHSELIGKI